VAHVSGEERGTDADFRGSRRLTGPEEWIWYLVAAVSYIVLGIWHKWLLNWFVGPAWLVTIVVAGPWLTDRLGVTGRRLRSRRRRAA
jgi:energy-converting hydrogenase Eha subunit G